MPVYCDEDFWCPYCGCVINANQVHEPNHHQDIDELDPQRAVMVSEMSKDDPRRKGAKK